MRTTTTPKSNSMPAHNLKKALNRLSEIAPNRSPLLSCFLDLKTPKEKLRMLIQMQAQVLSRNLPERQKAEFEEAFAKVDQFIADGGDSLSQGAAVYVRAGAQPFFLTMEFTVAMETRLVVDSLPHLYPVIETKDTYHRFVIVIVTEDEARIVETVMGAVTQEIFTKRPELRQRLGREWTRERYQNHKRDRNQKFMQTKVEIVDEMMQQRGHNHLVVAGSPKMIACFTNALPPRLKKKVVNTLYANPKSGVYSIVVQAVELFAANEHIESHDRVQKLQSDLLVGGLAVAGVEATRKALLEGYGDVLVIDRDFAEPGIKEELVRIATRTGIEIETVKDSPELKQLSGVGCLLRYRPQDYVWKEPEQAA